jgi:hypothetical protein
MLLEKSINSVWASLAKSPTLVSAVKEASQPLAAAVLRELYPYIYFSLILVTTSFILHIAVFGLIIKYSRTVEQARVTHA